MEKLSFSELIKEMEKDLSIEKYGVVVFSNDSFVKNYDIEDRSYVFSNKENYFKSGLISNALTGCALSGCEVIRLDYYLGEWEIEYCYLANSEVADAAAQKFNNR